jgi:uncharacterized protein
VIVPDVNVLVHAYRREMADHPAYAAWLNAVVGGSEDLGLVEPVLTGFVRIVTHRRIFAEPAPTADALGFVLRLRSGRRSRALTATDAVWVTLAEFVDGDRNVHGNRVPDAWIASMAIAHGGTVATRDTGFRRFGGLRSFDPVAPG